MIYLDNAATTKIAPEVFDAALPYLQDQYGNAGSSYRFGRQAKDAIETARIQVAGLLNCQSENIIFTSGGTESNNLVFKGLKDALLKAGKRHVIVSAIEHDSVLRAAESLIKYGFDISYVKPYSDGTVLSGAVAREIREDTGLVSVMYVNNETGALSDISEISSMCNEEGIIFHSDCVQAVGSQYINTQIMPGLHFASISAHKIHGFKGVGALYAKKPSILTPLISGGGAQEFGQRGAPSLRPCAVPNPALPQGNSTHRLRAHT